LLIWAACCIGFFAFMRLGKITVKRSIFDPSVNLTPRDIAVDNIQNPIILNENKAKISKE